MGIVSKYFVIKPRSKRPNDVYARAARLAMMAFSKEIGPVDPDLAKSLRLWAVKEQQLESALPPLKPRPTPVWPDAVLLVPGEIPRMEGDLWDRVIP